MRTVRNFSRKQILEIAKQYVELSDEAARTFFCEEYSISNSTFYSILYTAVSKCIVSDAIVEEMCLKAARNAKSHAGERARVRTMKNYYRLCIKRKHFKFPKKETKKIAKEYAGSLYTREQFCDSYPMTKELFNRTLIDAIVHGIIGYQCIEDLRKKAIKIHGTEKVIPFFSMLIQERIQNQKNKIK